MIDSGIYINEAKSKLQSLLKEQKDASTKAERRLQALFEEYPFLITGLLTGVDSQYQIFGDLIISQPEFKSFHGDRSPDFLVVTSNSLNLFFNFIELEDPSKKVFLKTEQKPTTDFTHAYNQLIQWQTYANSEVQAYCRELLRTLFNGNFNNTPEKNIHYNFILAYGFSDEIVEFGERHNDVFQGYFRNNLLHTTYSRVLKNIRYENPMFTVKKDVSTGFHKAIGFTPFRKYDNHCWSDFHNIRDKQALIRTCSLMTEEEQNRLIEDIDLMDRKSFQEIINSIMESPGISFGDIELP